MERFIRKKYQERNLSEATTRPQMRNEGSPPVPPKSPESPPAPPVPSKKGRFFGFGLRASSSAYPLSKHDKKKLPPEPRVESAFTISSDDYGSVSGMSDAELQRKLVQLRDMGFSDTERNTNLLRRLNGSVGKTVEALVQLGPSVGQRESSTKAAPQPTEGSRRDVSFPEPSEPSKPAPGTSNTSNNPFQQASSGPGFGISMPSQQPQTTRQSNNPFDQPARSQTDSGLVNSFQGMQVSQPVAPSLFPNSTGGYPVQQPHIMNPRLQSMTPPVSMTSQQYSYVASPSAVGSNTNPFFQSLQPQATGNNPFFAQQQQGQQLQQQSFPQPQQPQQPQQQPQMPNMTMANPFMSTNNTAQQSNALSPSYNPFGLPPSQRSPPQSSQGHANFFNSASAPPSATSSFPPSNPFQQQAPQQAAQQLQGQEPLQFPNFQYGQPQLQQQQHVNPYQTPSNPYASPNQPQFMQMPQQSQPAYLMPQQTGRHDKNSILALYNHPQLAPSQPQGLTSIAEPSNEPASPQLNAMNIAGKRSATMPISMSSMHSAGGGGNVAPNRNPYFQTHASPQQPMAAAPAPGIMARHVSQESVNISNLDSGRHSPDAFANLSARYVR